MSGPEILDYDKRDGIVVITLNRPERPNAFTPELFERLDDAWSRFREDDDSLVAIVTAAGNRAFSTGMDLKDQAERVARDPAFDIVKLMPRVLDGTMGTPRGNRVHKPVIAAINGIATAGGFQMAMQCDIRIAVESARIGVAEAKVGRGSPWAVPLLFQLPMALASEILLTAGLMPVQRLHAVGWINHVVREEELMPTALRLAQCIRDNAPLSLRAGKAMLDEVSADLLRAGLERAMAIYAPAYASKDAAEGPRAFAEKRKPRWTGQ